MDIDLSQISTVAANTRRISDRVSGWIDDAIQEHGQGENIVWEPTVMPGPNGGAVFVLLFWMPGAVLGTQMQGSVALQDPLNIDAAEINRIVAEFLRQMREGRSQQIAQQAAQATQQPAGAGAGPSGLFLP